MSGWSLNRRVRIVDLPEPEGPDITIGRWVWSAGLSEGAIEGVLGVRGKYLWAPLRNSCCRRNGAGRQEARAGAVILSTRKPGNVVGKVCVFGTTGTVIRTELNWIRYQGLVARYGPVLIPPR